ncbi:MAG: T9SS type A sorting domain-containing protein [Ignavibacteriae bacterium]|nr:T9SS type A sorting domain-containing protein [Ignavibacteriota bacterium]
MNRRLTALVLLCLSLSGAHAGNDGCSTKGQWLARTSAEASTGDPGIDVTYYRLGLRLSPGTSTLQGEVRVTAKVVAASITGVTLDLSGEMAVDSVKMGRTTLMVTRYPESFLAVLPAPALEGAVVSLDVYYHGTPAPTGFGSFAFSAVAQGPWIWSLSQPYGARDWWPCKDHQLDKADSADIIVTCPAGLKVGSNGLLRSVTDNSDGTTTYFWAERYPIATYLISIAVGPFASFSNWYRYSATDSMEVLNYVLPSHLAIAQQELPKAVPMLEIFSRLYGQYPFLEEKYGHSEFGRGGAMEHQTMTSTTTFDEDVVAHELAHQWFGDLITCRTWQDLWLNEGFATYSESLYREARYGTAEYHRMIRRRMSSAFTAQGSLFVMDTTTVGNLFASNRVYAKGAWVLHMLRHVVGDSVFFRALRAYAADPRFRYGTASTADFQGICESVSGTSLAWFFSQWIYGEKYPRYTLRWEARPAADRFMIVGQVDQETRTTTPSFFVMPVDIRFSNGSRDTTVVIRADQKSKDFTVELPFMPTGALVDPDLWILREVADPEPLLPVALTLDQNFPNPFNGATSIRARFPQRTPASLEVYSVLGAHVVTLFDGIAEAGVQTWRWEGRDDRGNAVASGVYLYRLTAGASTQSRSMIYMR